MEPRGYLQIDKNSQQLTNKHFIEAEKGVEKGGRIKGALGKNGLI